MDVLLANPRGFCAGVDRAIAIVEEALRRFGAPIYVRHEVVHNRFVVDDLKAKGAIFVDDLAAIPRGSTVIFSAHGVSRAVRADAEARGLRVFDATCPLVTKVHVEVAKMRGQGREIVMIGHAGHPEVEGTMGQSDAGIHLVESVADVARLALSPSVPLAYVTQTTLSVDDAAGIVAALKARYPAIVGPKKDDICYATQNRQDAVKAMGGKKRIAHFTGWMTDPNTQTRINEVQRAAKEGGAEVVQVIADIDEPLVAAEKIGAYLAAHAKDIDGIITTAWVPAVEATNQLLSLIHISEPTRPY